MINRQLFYCASVLLMCCASCATSSIPQVIIPKNAGQLDVNASLASNGAHVNTLYATGKRHFITGAFHRSRFDDGDKGTIYGELGAGMVSLHGKTATMLSFGHGKFAFGPSFIRFEGREYPYYWYYGHYFRTALTVNSQFSPGVGMTNRLDVYTGTDNGISDYSYGIHQKRFFNRSIIGVNYEPVVYFKSVKRSGLIYLMGFDLGIITIHKKETDPVYFRLPFVFISLGWNMNLLKGWHHMQQNT